MGIGDKREYPHDIFLETVSESGFIGLLLLLGCFWVALHTFGFNELSQDRAKLLVLMLLANTFFNALVSGDLNDNRLLFASIGLMAICQPSRTAKHTI